MWKEKIVSALTHYPRIFLKKQRKSTNMSQDIQFSGSDLNSSSCVYKSGRSPTRPRCKRQVNSILKSQLYGKMRKVSREGSVLPEMHIMLEHFARFRRRKVNSSVVFSFECLHSTDHLVHGQCLYQTGLRRKVPVLYKDSVRTTK